MRWMLALLLTSGLQPCGLAQAYMRMGVPPEHAWAQNGMVMTSVTPDGNTIAMLEGLGFGTCHVDSVQRISVIHTDGTGYRIVVSSEELERLPSHSPFTWVFGMRISPDGRKIAFWRPQDGVGCSPHGQTHVYLADVATSTVKEIKFTNYWLDGQFTFTNDGRILLRGFDPNGSEGAFLLTDPEGENAQIVLDLQQWPAAFGMISGNGKKIVFSGCFDIFGNLCNIYVHELETGVTTIVSDQPKSHTYYASISEDGTRVVYAHSLEGGAIYAVNADGTDHRILLDLQAIAGSTPSITGDGELVYVWPVPETGLPILHRIGWDGTDLQAYPAVDIQLNEIPNQEPIDRQGQIGAYVADTNNSTNYLPDLALLRFELPWLITGSTEELGAPLTIAIGGDPGDVYIVASSPTLAPIDVPAYGTLELDVASLMLLDIRTFPAGGPKPPINTAIIEAKLPKRPELVGLPLHFQALVLDPHGGAGAFTNRTTIVLHD